MYRPFIPAIMLLLTLFGCEQQAEVKIVPQPVSLEVHRGTFEITENTEIVVKPGDQATLRVAQTLTDRFQQAAGFDLEIISGTGSGELNHRKKNTIVMLGGDADDQGEGYKLSVDHRGVVIEGAPAGLFYGVQTLYQLLPPSIYGGEPTGISWVVPGVEITDQPRFSWRGMHLDVSRHFFNVAFIKKYIDLLAMHKLNVFHWHLVDDQGWRIEIRRYPMLTEKAAWREGTGTEDWDYFVGPAVEGKPKYGGYYTQDEIREIVQYAADRFITVVPEIELPGHSRAVLDAYPQLSCTGKPYERWQGETHHFLPPYCAGNDQSFIFLENVLEEVMELFPSEYIHIGGDEVPKERWKTCVKCQQRMKEEGLKDENELQSYFITRIERFINAHGRNIIGWDEILEGGLAPHAAVMSWQGTEGGIAAAKLKHPVVMSPVSHLYFNTCQTGEPHRESVACGGFLPLEKVYSFEPVPETLDSEESGYILGAQGNVWTEGIQTPGDVETMALPRMSALSEVVWSVAEDRDYEDFTNRMKTQYQRLDQLGVHYFGAPDSLK